MARTTAEYIGGSFDKAFGGRAVRGLLGGKLREALSIIPFSDTLGITNHDDTVTGRQLLENAGMFDPGEEGAAPFWAGLGVDMLTDPLTYFGPGLLTKGLGKAGEGMSALSKLGARAAPELPSLAEGGVRTAVQAAPEVADALAGGVRAAETGVQAGAEAAGDVAKAAASAGQTAGKLAPERVGNIISTLDSYVKPNVSQQVYQEAMGRAADELASLTGKSKEGITSLLTYRLNKGMAPADFLSELAKLDEAASAGKAAVGAGEAGAEAADDVSKAVNQGTFFAGKQAEAAATLSRESFQRLFNMAQQKGTGRFQEAVQELAKTAGIPIEQSETLLARFTDAAKVHGHENQITSAGRAYKWLMKEIDKLKAAAPVEAEAASAAASGATAPLEEGLDPNIFRPGGAAPEAAAQATQAAGATVDAAAQNKMFAEAMNALMDAKGKVPPAKWMQMVQQYLAWMKKIGEEGIANIKGIPDMAVGNARWAADKAGQGLKYAEGFGNDKIAALNALLEKRLGPGGALAAKYGGEAASHAFADDQFQPRAMPQLPPQLQPQLGLAARLRRQ